jgi:hypothetical protein
MSRQEEQLNPSKHTAKFDLVQAVNAVNGGYTMKHLLSSNRGLNVVHSLTSTKIRRTPGSTAARAFFTPNRWSQITVAVVVWISFALVGVLPAAARNVPTGTIELSGGSVAAGVGYTWGQGTLIFDGKKYPLKVDGISILQVGVSDYTATGTVYNLKQVSDINGVYTAFSAGAAVAGGASVTAMKNSRGVVIQMVATHEGLNLSLGAKGVTIALKQD